MGKLRNYSGGVGKAGDFVDTPIVELDPSTNLQVDQSPTNKKGLRSYGAPMSMTEINNDILPSEYSSYFYPVYGGVGEPYLQKHRAQNQTKGDQILGFLNQAIIGEIGGGTIESLGYLLDLETYGNLYKGTEEEFGNWFSNIGKSLRTWTEETSPIYTDPDAPKFDPGSFAWWMKNGKSVASTLSFMIPSGIAIKGLSTITKALGAFQKISPMASWGAKGITQAGISRHMESMMEASGLHEEAYQEALQKGMSPTDAQEYAAKAAAKNYSLNWAMFLQDLPQYLLLNKSFGKASVGLAEKSIAATAAMGHKLAPVISSKAAAIGWDMIGEGFEEGYQFIAAEEAKYLTEKLYDPSVESSFDERLNKYIKDGELWTSVVMGAIGAGVMQTVGKSVNKLIQGGDAQLKFVKNFSTEVALANSQVRAADIIGSESAKEGAITNFERVLFESAAVTGSMDNAKEMLKITANPSPEDIKRFNITPEDAEFLRENQDRLLQDAEEFERRWESNSRKYESEKAARVTRFEFIRDKYDKARKKYAAKAKDLEFSITNFDKLSPEAQDIFNLSANILSNNRMIQFQQRRLDNKEHPLKTEEIKEAKDSIDKAEKINKKLQDQIDKIEQGRTDEDRKTDDEINIGGPHNVSGLKDKNEITNHSYLEYLTNKEAETFADLTVKVAQNDLDKLLKQKDKKSPKPPKPEPEENAVDIDDYVVYTKDGKQFTGIVDSIDDKGNYIIIPTSKWNDKSNAIPTRPSGDPITVAPDKVVRDKRQYTEEDENFEPVGVDDLIEEKEDEYVHRTPQYMISYYDKKHDSENISYNNELHDFLLKSKGNLEGVSVEFYIDTTSDYAKQWFATNKFSKKEIKDITESRSTNKYIDDLLKNKDIVGNIPIGVYLVKDNKKILVNNSGIYLRSTSFESLSDTESKSLLALRDKIIKNLLKGNVVSSSNLLLSTGAFNNTRDSRGNVTERLGLSTNDVVVGISRTNGRVYIGNSSLVPGVISDQEGTPYAYTNKTANGKGVWVKLNPTKLTREHAEILYDAIKTRYSKNKGSLAPFPDDRVAGLNVGEVIQLLALFGEQKTNPEHRNHATKRSHLKKNRLYVHSANILYFGETGKINIHEDNIEKAKANKEEFVKWATENKNYTIPIALSKMGVGLNNPLKRTFKIGAWENKPDDKGNYLTHAQFLATVPVDGKSKTALVSDLNKDMPFIRPNLIFAQTIDDIKITENPDKKRSKTPPKSTPESRSTKKAVKQAIKNGELKDTLTLMSLPVGSEIYLEYPEIVEDDGNIIEANKTLVARIYQDSKLGVLLDIRPSKSTWNEKYEWTTIRDLEGNKVENSKSILDGYLTILKQKANSYGAKVIVDVSGTPEVKVVEQEEVKTEENIPQDVDSFSIEQLRKAGVPESIFKEWTDAVKEKQDYLINSGLSKTGRIDAKYTELENKAKELLTKVRQNGIDYLKNKLSKKKSDEDIGDVLNDILGIGMDATIPTDGSYVDLTKETKWLKKKFGDQNIKEVDKLITLASSGRLAFSVFTSDCIYVYTGAPEGALYHEAFHRVELGYLSEEDRQKIYASARKYFDMPNATDTEISEQLAEGFRNYKLTGSKPKSRTIWQFFKDLYNFIYTFFTGNTALSSSEISRLYDSIERGQYKYSKISVENFNKLKNIQTPMAVEIRKQKINSINNYHELDKVVRFLTGILINTNNINNLNDIHNIKMSKMFEHIEKQSERLATAIDAAERQIQAGLIPKEELQQKLNQIRISRNLYNVFLTVLDKNYTHLFINKISDNLRRLNVKYNFDEDLYLENKENNNYKAIYDQASYEINLKDNMLASVKFMIATLHKSPELDPNIGIQEYVEFNKMWNSIMYHLHDIKDSNDMMKRLEELALTSHPYKELHSKIVNDKTGYLKEQVRQSVQRHRHDFINFLVELSKKEGVKKIDIRDADVNKASKLLIAEWNLFFYSTNSDYDKKGGVKANKDSIQLLVDTYNKLNTRVDKEMSANNKQLKDPDSYIAALHSLLNASNIPVEEEVLRNYINNREGKDLSDKIFQTISNDFSYVFKNMSSDNSTKLRKMFTDESTITKLADEYVKLHPDLISDIVLGPGNNQFYVYSQNSYVTDIVNRIKTDKKFLEDRLSKIYNDNSFYGGQLLESDKVREGIKVSTFSMVGAYGQDGNNYLEISPIEDYIFKLISFRNNIIAFPTMADKRTYYLLKGLKTFDFDFVHSGDSIQLPIEATNILFGYAKSEKRRIDKAIEFRNSYNEAVASGNEERVKGILRNAVENYHYIIDPKGNIIFEGGSAYKFHHFPSLNGRENLVMDESIRKEISSSLVTNILDELDYAEQIGIISSTIVNNKKIYKNILLPNELVADEKGKHGSEDRAIRNIIASFTVNSIIANVENEKLFSGDPAFYKADKGTKSVIEDKVKRLSVLSSTGDNFANSVEEKDITDSTFNVATIETQKFTSAYYSQLKDVHVELNKDVYKELHPEWTEEQIDEEAKKTADMILKPYRDVDPTDGQAWITPAMYRSLSIRLGEWSDEKQKAFDILISGEDFSKDIEKEKKVLKATFQPLKLVYFDLIHDGDLAIPTYHKASFATIFRSMGKGKYGNMQIIDVLDRMEKKGIYEGQNIPTIDMFVADSATKVGNRVKSKIFDGDLENIINLSGVEVYQQNFEGLRRQLVTDAHDVDRTKTGTQFIKVALSNLELDKNAYGFNGKNVNGRYIANEAFNCLNNLSDRGREVIEKRLGYSNGRINKTKLIELLREDAEKSNATDNLIDSLHMINKDDMYLELDSLVDHKWIQSRIISLISKHTIDVRLPGNQFIQFSNMGIRSINKQYTFEKESKDSNKHITWLNKATDELPFLINEKGEHIPMGCIVSINLFKHLIPNYDTITYEEKLEYLKSNPEIIGYRIPTQGQSSLFTLKVAGVYPETIGDTITLPAEFTALTGSDFDIDKVYVVRYNYSVSRSKKKLEKIKFHEGDTSDPKFLSKVYKDRYGKIVKAWQYIVATTSPIKNPDFVTFDSEQISVLKQIRELTDDVSVDENIQKLLDNGTYNEMYYEKISDILLAEDKIDENKFMAYNLNKSIYEVNSKKAVENRLLDSFFSVLRSKEHLQYTSAPLGGLTDMLKELARDVRKLDNKSKSDMYYLSPRFNEKTKHTYTGGKDGIGPFALNNVHHILSQIAGLKMSRGLGDVLHETNGKIDLSKKYNKYDNILISAWLSALIDAHVDVAKDPYIMDLNVNSYTYNVVALLIRGGLGMKTFEFLAQPILKEVAEEEILGDKNNILPKTFTIPLVVNGNIVRDEENGEIVYVETTAKNFVLNKWLSKLTEEEKKEIDKLSINEIANKILLSDLRGDLFVKEEDRDNKEFIIKQILVYKLFEELNTLGNNLSDLIQASQVDTKKFGSNINEVRLFLDKILKVYETGAFEKESLNRVLPYDPYNDEAINIDGANFLGHYTNNSIGLSLKIIGDFSLYGTAIFDSILDNILTITQNKFKTDSKFINNISDEIFATIVSKFFTDPSYIGITPEQLSVIMEMVPYRLSKIKTNKDGAFDDVKDNMFLNYLYPMATDNPELLPEALISYIMVPIKSVKDKADRDSMIASFQELIDHPNTEVSTFARQLFYYSFFASGLRSRIFSFHNFMPNDLYKKLFIKDPADRTKRIPISFNDDFMRKVLAEMKDISNISSYNNIIDEVIINNHENKDLVRIVKGKQIQDVTTEYKGKKYSRPIAVTIKERNIKQLYLGNNKDGKPLYRPYIKVYDEDLGHIILKYIGTIEKTNTDASTVNLPVYVTQNMRSYSRKGVVVKEYNMPRSIIPTYNELNAITKAGEEEFLIHLSDNGVYTYLPREEQVIDTTKKETSEQLELGFVEQLNTEKNGMQEQAEETGKKEIIQEESPFISDEKDVFSTEPQGVAELVDEFGIKTSDDWTKLTPEQRRKLEEKYKHCKGII